MTLLTKVRTCINEHRLLNPENERVLVALSGGPDSVALLHVLSQLRQKLKFELFAVYVNHNIRKRAAKKEEGFCSKLCRTLRVELHRESVDVPALALQNKSGLEETARQARYEIFDRLAGSHGYTRIAVGHHVDDRVETVLFRVLRGTGRTGLAGIPVSRGRIIRPLFYATRKEILDYLADHRMRYCEDQSNSSSEFKRNFIRNELLPFIRESLNPAVDAALLNLADTAGEEERYLDQLVQELARKCVSRSRGGKIELDLRLFGTYDRWIRRRLLRHCLAQVSDLEYLPDKNVIDRIDRFAVDKKTSMSLPERMQVSRADSRLVFHRRKGLVFKYALDVPGKTDVEELSCRISVERKDVDHFRAVRNPRKSVVYLDAGKLGFPLFVRSVKAGDRFRPLGMTGTKKVGDYLIDRKVPRVFRDEIAVVCDKHGIVWLVEFEIDDRVKIEKETREVICLEVSTKRQSGIKAD